MTPGLTSYDVVIFDCVGVLVDSEPISVDVEARMLTELGWPMTVEDVIARWMGRTSRAQLLEVTERLGAAASEEFDRRVTAEVHSAFETSLTPVDGAVQVEHGKPAPDLFLLAADGMGVPPERCAVIEDSVNGVRAGVAAGMTTYGYAGGLSAESELAAAGAVTFERMADLWAGPPPR